MGLQIHAPPRTLGNMRTRMDVRFFLFLAVVAVSCLVQALPPSPGSHPSSQGGRLGGPALDQQVHHNRRRKHSSRIHHEHKGYKDRKLWNGGDPRSSTPGIVEIRGSKDIPNSPNIDGIYSCNGVINDAPHYQRSRKLNRARGTSPVHLYFTGLEWVIHHQLDPAINTDNCLAYSKVTEADPLRTTRKWLVKIGSTWMVKPRLRVMDLERASRVATGLHSEVGVHTSRQ
ncbi:unnamed protein product [Discosporangium mesarthrocarpum]